MPTEYELSAAAIVLEAREYKGLSQDDFARLIGKTQSVVSKYETAQIQIPGEIVMRCITILGLLEGKTPSAEDVAELVRTTLGDPGKAALRRALAGLVTSLERPKRP